MIRNSPGISEKLISGHFLCKNIRFCDTLSTMECENNENKYFIKTIYTILWKI